MYNSQDLAIRIKAIAKDRNKTIKEMLVDLNLGSNTMSSLYHGRSIAHDSLAKIADYLDCSTDYLLGRTDKPSATYFINGDNNVQVNGNNGDHSPLTVNSHDNGNDNTTAELVELVRSLPLVKKAEAIIYLNGLKKK